jgi:Periplasmic protein TonB, links inner and outer membranes
MLYLLFQFWNCAEVTVVPGGPTAPVAQPVAQPVSPPVAQPVSQPVSPPVAQPVSQPVSQPVAPPAPAPTTTGGFCNYGPDGTGATSTCEGGAEGGPWCNQSNSNCLNCNGRWCTVGTNDNTPSPTHHPSLRATASPTKSPVDSPPTTTQENTFCCSYDHFNCSDGEWCNQSEGNCLACSGAWISTTPPTNCRLAKWATCTNDPTGCCGSTCNGAPGDWYRQCV